MGQVRRLLTALVLTVLVLLAAALVADRVMLARAEARVVDQLDAYLDVSGRPEVTIAGFPFLTQLLAGELGRVDATAPAAGSEGVELRDVEAQALRVTLEEPARVGELEVRGTLDEAALQRLVDDQSELDLTLVARADGLEAATEVLGLEVALTVDPVVVGESLRLQVRTVTLGGVEVGAAELAPLLGEDQLTVDLAVPDLPLGLRLASVAPQDGGVRLTLTGSDVVLSEP